MRNLLRVLVAVTVVAACGAAAPSGIDALRWTRRVILVSAPVADDAKLLDQQRALAEWRQVAEDRDVTVVEIVGAAVDGVGGRAVDLRTRYALPAGQFTVVLESVRTLGLSNSVQQFPDSGGKQRPRVSTLVHVIIRLLRWGIWGVVHGCGCRDPSSSFGQQGEHQLDCA